MNIKPIRTRKPDYIARPLSEVESLMTAKANTPEGDSARRTLATLVAKRTERTHFPMDLPDAVEAIKFRMEQSGLTVKDLEPVIGRSNRVFEVLNRKRPLTLRMIEGLAARFGILGRKSAEAEHGKVFLSATVVGGLPARIKFGR